MQRRLVLKGLAGSLAMPAIAALPELTPLGLEERVSALDGPIDASRSAQLVIIDDVGFVPLSDEERKQFLILAVKHMNRVWSVIKQFYHTHPVEAAVPDVHLVFAGPGLSIHWPKPVDPPLAYPLFEFGLKLEHPDALDDLSMSANGQQWQYVGDELTRVALSIIGSSRQRLAEFLLMLAEIELAVERAS